MAIHIKRVLYSSLIALSVLSSGSAHCQTASPPKLAVINIGLYQLSADGFFNASVDLGLDRGPNNPRVNFRITIQHVHSLNELYDKLKPAIDDLVNEVKTASEGFHPPQ